MVDFIVNNYVIIMIVSVFLVFALIGYAVDTTKNKSKKEKEILTEANDVDASVLNEQIMELEKENRNEQVSVNNEEELESPINNDIPEADAINLNTDNN